MADRDGVVVDADDDYDYDYDYDHPSRTVGELIRRSRLCFCDSDFAKVESVLTARVNKMKEEIGASERANQLLKNELKNLDRDKRKAESEVERWITKYRLLESRILTLEKLAEQLKSREDGIKVSGENGGKGENVELENEVLDVDAGDSEEIVDLVAARNVGVDREGSGGTPIRNIVEIIDSDDESAPEGSSTGKESTSQRVANTAHPDQTSLQNVAEMVKRKHDSSLRVSENDNNDGAVAGEPLTDDCNGNKRQKVIHMHDASPNNHGAPTDNNVETCFTPSSRFPVTLRECEEKMGAEQKSRNLMSEFLLDASGGCSNEYSSSSSSSSSDSDSDDDVNMNFEFFQHTRQQDNKKWGYEADVLISLGKDDELCLKAVCALYRQQTSSGTSLRGTALAKFLVDGDPQGRLKKSVSELLQFDPRGLADCRSIALGHTKQLLEIYKRKEDPLFLP